MLRKLSVYFLIVAVFISGNGVVFAIHVCFSSSTKTVSLFEDQSCNGMHAKCCDDEGTNNIKSNCCQLQYSYYKLELPSASKKFSIVDFMFPALITQVIFTQDPKLESLECAILKVPDHRIDIPIFFSQLLI